MSSSKRKSSGGFSASGEAKKYKVGDIVEVEEDRGPGFNEYGAARITAVNGSEYDVKFIVSSLKATVDEEYLSHAIDSSGLQMTSPSRSSGRALSRRTASIAAAEALAPTSSRKGNNIQTKSPETVQSAASIEATSTATKSVSSLSAASTDNSSTYNHKSHALIFGVFAIMFFFWIDSLRGYMPPSHMQGHSLLFHENFIPKKIGKELREMLYSVGASDGFPTNMRDITFYTAKHEHIGEAVPLNSEGGCDHALLTPSKDGTTCVLPGRVDIGSHFIKTGGVEGLKESYSTLVSRLLSFGMYVFDLEKAPAVKTLFESAKFTKLAKNICPPSKQVLDPFQFNFIIQVPGQSVASHLDGVYYWGASRFDFPQWLLAAMKVSGLPQFEEHFIDQVQVVGYLHEWEPDARTKGEFVYFDGSSRLGGTQPPLPLAASGVDGTKTVHAAMIYRPDELPPKVNKDDDAKLVFKPSKKGGKKLAPGSWAVEAKGNIVRNYTLSDLRTSIVYRARCFASEAEKIEYQNQVESDHSNHALSLDNVLKVFAEDMESRKLLSNGATAEERVSNVLANTPEARLDLALNILSHYVKYPNPIPPATLPWNYCALPRLVPWTSSFLSPFCR